jgi:hypothetical protein
MKQSSEKSEAKDRSARPGRLARLTLDSLNLHIMEKGAAEALDAVTKRRYEHEAEEVTQKIRALAGPERSTVAQAASGGGQVAAGSRTEKTSLVRRTLSRRTTASASRKSRPLFSSAGKATAKRSASRAPAKKK